MPDNWEEETDLDVQLERLRDHDINGWAFAMILAKVEADIDQGGWDQPPMLMSVQRHLDVPIEHIAMAFLVTELPAPLHGLDGDGIEKLLIYTARKMAKSPKLIPDLFGFILVHEAWMRTNLTQTDIDRYQHGDLAKMSDRIEIRALAGVDTAGIAYSLMHRRDHSDRQLMVDGIHDFRAEGRFNDAMRMLTSASTPEPPV